MILECNFFEINKQEKPVSTLYLPLFEKNWQLLPVFAPPL